MFGRSWIRVTLVGLGVFLGTASAAAELDPQSINGAQFTDKAPPADRISPLTIKLQVLLARARFSPGEIDGKYGENVRKALQAFDEANRPQPSKELTREVWEKLAADQDPTVTQYVTTERDVGGPFLQKLPPKMEDLKGLKTLGYTSASEALAEKFHMSEALLAALNPGKRLDQPGVTLTIANVVPTSGALPAVARIAVDKTRQTVKAFAKSGEMVGFYPATVGSEEKPTPSGMLKVTSVTRNPTYRYNPDYKFKGVRSKEPFTINPGPNNPVGTVWIALSGKDGYGIHGTPSPGKISKSESHGCVRLTNWDAEQLAAAVTKGTSVSFLEGGEQNALQKF